MIENARLDILLIVCLFLTTGCSVRKFAINKLGDSLANSGTKFAADDDPELVRDAVPFSLKLIEGLLAESPKHRGLLFAAASGFTQYSYAFVHLEADLAEERDLARAHALRGRARGLYLRARNYGLQGLEIRHPGFASRLRAEPHTATLRLQRRDVPLVYWTAVAWGAAISVSKTEPDIIADQPLVEALIDRALELDEAYENGAIHNFLIAYELARTGASGDASERAREHFNRAVHLSNAYQVGPLVAFAESVCVPKQNRTEFEALLQRAIALDIDARPEWRLANTLMQRRARWLLGRADELFVK